MDLKKIIRGCKNRDRKSREELYLHTADDVMNICIRYTVDKSSAKDIFQDTYLKIFNAIESYDEKKGAIGGWIARITVNTALSYLKKQSRIDLKDTFLSDIEPITNEDPIADLSAKEIFAQVASLPDGYRVIFNLFVVEGYSHKEIGELLQITPSTSRSQLARAKSLLKKNITSAQNSMIYEAS